ncbi:hypothetical protein H4W34_005675 [Actinomadura algeriensis]|uniref:Uncharacterized protein n=1 Tax=Actinomadura algeriensis TaxID=1679523 RepID=A0ABR9JZ37_9ACTN|nr:hypothetical protein [Actinomadura algeriensis]
MSLGERRPSMPPQILAAALLLQALHGLSDFEAGAGVAV